jgi:hypothetical protein
VPDHAVMKLVTLGAAAAVLAVLGVVATPAAYADEETFLKTLEVGGFSWTGDGQALVDLGREICSGLNTGMSVADIITEGSRELGWTPTQVGYFTGAAASEFCPQHLERAITEAKTLEG